MKQEHDNENSRYVPRADYQIAKCWAEIWEDTAEHYLSQRDDARRWARKLHRENIRLAADNLALVRENQRLSLMLYKSVHGVHYE